MNGIKVRHGYFLGLRILDSFLFWTIFFWGDLHPEWDHGGLRASWMGTTRAAALWLLCGAAAVKVPQGRKITPWPAMAL